MFKKKVKIIVISVIVCSILTNVNVVHAASGACFLGGVERVQQAKSNWCWAACAEMVGVYETTSTLDQWDVVALIYGSTYPNNSGSVFNIVSGINYVSRNTKAASFSRFISLETLQSEIGDKHHPLVIRLAWESGGGHFVVAKGYNGSSINIIDPWGNTATQYYSYASLLNGGTFANGTGTAEHVVFYN